MRTTLFVFISLTLFAMDLASAQQATDQFPKHPLTIIIPGSPGAGSHRLSVTTAKLLERLIGVPVNYINKPGNNGMKAIEYYMSLPPNGYTILQHFDGIASQRAQSNEAIDPIHDLTPISIAQITYSQLYVRNSDKRFPDWKAFASYAKNHPNLKIAKFGDERSMEGLLLNMLGLGGNAAAAERSSERYLSLVDGRVDALIEQPGDVRAFLNQGLIRPILNFLPKAELNSPDLASLADVSRDTEALYRFRGFFVHAKVPKERQRFLQRAFKAVFNTKEFQAYNQSQYITPGESFRDDEHAREYVRDAIATYHRLYAHQRRLAKLMH